MSSADLVLLAVSLIWGSTFVVVKGALGGISTLLFLALRFTFAAALLAAILAPRFRSGPSRGWFHGWRGGLICSGFLFLGYVLQTAGLRLTPASRSAFLTGLYIVLVPLLSTLVNLGRPRSREVAGVLLALAGTLLLTLTGTGWRPENFAFSGATL
jgi:drug/metabolite transporter (DMT)-like permease